MKPTHFAPATNLLWTYLESCGHDPAPLYVQAGINPELLRKPDARISVDHVDELWRLAAALLQDPAFGVRMAAHWHPSYLGALGYAWCASSSLRTALERVLRYSHVVSEELNIHLKDTPEGLKVTLDLENAIFTLPQHHDVVLAVMMDMCRFNFGQELTAVRVTFDHAAPADASIYASFFRSPLQFDATASTLTLATRDVDRPLSSGNSRIALMHDDVLMRYLIDIRKGDFVNQLKSIIIEQLPSGHITDNQVASRLNLSERSLQRKLHQHGTSFRNVLEDVRRQAAEQYIRNPDMRMSDIAFLLGFSEQSAFSRAFKKWLGLPPLKYRERLLRQG